MLTVGGDYTYKTWWNLKKVNGKDYMDIQKYELDFKLKRAYFDFENLFNGDKTLGKTDFNLIKNC